MSTRVIKNTGKLELWVADTGLLEGFTVYVDGKRFKSVFAGGTNKFPIPQSTGATIVVAVRFGGADGGKSAIVDTSDADGPDAIEQQTGLSHVYEVA